MSHRLLLLSLCLLWLGCGRNITPKNIDTSETQVALNRFRNNDSRTRDVADRVDDGPDWSIEEVEVESGCALSLEREAWCS